MKIKKTKKQEFIELLQEVFYTRRDRITFKNLGNDFISFWVLLFGLIIYLPYMYIKFRMEGDKTCHVFKMFWCEDCDYKKGTCKFMKKLPEEFEVDVKFNQHLFLMRERRIWWK